MRVRSTHVRPAHRNVLAAAGAAALILTGASACSKGSTVDSSSIKPNIPSLTTAPRPSQSASGTPAQATPDPAVVPNYDASSAMALKLQETGCKTALSPLFGKVVKGLFTQDRVLAVTPAAARDAMKQSFANYALILSQDPHAADDGQASKATKPLDAFCATPAGAPLVGTTPVDALTPPKPTKR